MVWRQRTHGDVKREREREKRKGEREKMGRGGKRARGERDREEMEREAPQPVYSEQRKDTGRAKYVQWQHGTAGPASKPFSRSLSTSASSFTQNKN